MKIEIKVPQLPESVSEATLLNWHVKVNEFVKRETNLIDLETDKVVLELPAIEDGAVVEMLGKSGDAVKSGQVIGYIDTEVAAPKNSAPKVEAKESEKIATKVEPVANMTTATNDSAKPIVMPSAAKLAKENDVDLGNIAGSGRGSRILKEDVVAAVAKGGSRFEERVPMSKLRQRVAQRLLESQQNNAILTTFNEVNMQPVIDLRAKYKDAFEKKHGTKLGFMSFFVKAAISSLKQFPIINASVDGNDVVYHGFFDIGVAVSSPRGLVVPILRNAENLSVAAIEGQIVDFATRAKSGKLEIEELTGGTFTITNGGTFGSMMSTPIINPPQSAILGMHATKDRAVVENGAVVVRPMMYLALSYDHRIIDGKDAVQFLVKIKEALEDPARILLDI